MVNRNRKMKLQMKMGNTVILKSVPWRCCSGFHWYHSCNGCLCHNIQHLIWGDMLMVAQKIEFLRYRANGEAWKSFDEIHPDFALDPRNVRLRLAINGFNPFGIMSFSHNTWLVMLVPYNLPPWLCMKQQSFILLLLIPGPSSPGMDISVYL